jgi:hypothetical protein
LKKTSPGVLTGIVLGVLCLLVGLGVYLWAPGFTGFFNRPGAQPAMPVWTLLILLAAVNFVYAWLSWFLQRKIDQVAQKIEKKE